MQILGLVLILINIGAIAGPVAGVAIVYRDNLSELVIPPEINQIVEETSVAVSEFQLPQLVNYAYDPIAKTVTVVANFTNPFNLNVTINSLVADVVCNEHKVTLGHAGIAYPVELNRGVTAYITAVFAWSVDAEIHFLTQHLGESSISISLENIVVDISGITVEAPASYNIGNIPLPQV
jgi:hypothetical protein